MVYTRGPVGAPSRSSITGCRCRRRRRCTRSSSTPPGGVWSAGGNVLTPALDGGMLLHYGDRGAAGRDRRGRARPGQTPGAPVAVPGGVVAAGKAGIDRAALGRAGARRHPPRPPAAHGPRAQPLPRLGRDVGRVGRVRHEGARASSCASGTRPPTSSGARAPPSATRRTTCSRTATRRPSAGTTTLACLRAVMKDLGYDPDDAHDTGDDPIAFGNRIAPRNHREDGGRRRERGQRLRRSRPASRRQPAARLRQRRHHAERTPTRWQPHQPVGRRHAERHHPAGRRAGLHRLAVGQRDALRDEARVERRPLARPGPGAPPRAGDEGLARRGHRARPRASTRPTRSDDRHLPRRLRPQLARRERRQGLGEEPGDRRALRRRRSCALARLRARDGRVLGRRARSRRRRRVTGTRSPTRWPTRPASSAGSSARARRWIRSRWDVHVYLALNGAVHDAAIAAWDIEATHDDGAPDLARPLDGREGAVVGPEGARRTIPTGCRSCRGSSRSSRRRAARRGSGTQACRASSARSPCATGSASPGDRTAQVGASAGCARSTGSPTSAARS